MCELWQPTAPTTAVSLLLPRLVWSLTVTLRFSDSFSSIHLSLSLLYCSNLVERCPGTAWQQSYQCLWNGPLQCAWWCDIKWTEVVTRNVSESTQKRVSREVLPEVSQKSSRSTLMFTCLWTLITEEGRGKGAQKQDGEEGFSCAVASQLSISVQLNDSVFCGTPDKRIQNRLQTGKQHFLKFLTNPVENKRSATRNPREANVGLLSGTRG